jgi:hypothetical protein
MDRYTKENAIHQIKGYYFLRPSEVGGVSQAAFDRAKGECIENLSRDLQVVQDIQFADFIKEK